MAAQRADESPLQALWSALEPHGQLQSFRRYSHIYTPSQQPHTLFFLKRGQVSLQMSSSSGRILTLKVVDPGQIFGHSVLDGGAHYDTFAEALSPVQVVAVPRAAVFAAIAETPWVVSALIDQLGQYRLTISRRIDEVAFKSVPARLASVLLEMSGEHPDEDATAKPQKRVPRRTHQQLAEMINAYRETVTKVINQFRDAHLLDVDRSGITLLNPSRLRELSQN
jgi:CRP-like cAMP-binding protein